MNYSNIYAPRTMPQPTTVARERAIAYNKINNLVNWYHQDMAGWDMLMQKEDVTPEEKAFFDDMKRRAMDIMIYEIDIEKKVLDRTRVASRTLIDLVDIEEHIQDDLAEAMNKDKEAVMNIWSKKD